MGGDAEAASAAVTNADADFRCAALEPIQEASPTQEGAEDSADAAGGDTQTGDTEMVDTQQPFATAQLPDTEPAHSDMHEVQLPDTEPAHSDMHEAQLPDTEPAHSNGHEAQLTDTELAHNDMNEVHAHAYMHSDPVSHPAARCIERVLLCQL